MCDNADGGDGGVGGNVYIVGDTNVADLTDFHFKPGWKAKNGEPGRGSDQHGAKGEHITLRLPVGTIVVDRDSGDPIAEVLQHDDEVLLLEGGVGGKGNAQFKSSTNQMTSNHGFACEFLVVFATYRDSHASFRFE